MTLHSLPNVLVLHLKRFSFGNMFGKINRHIQFSPVLYLPSNDGDIGADGKQRMVKYCLHGIVVHYGGSTHSGHYVAFVQVTLAV